ncbi:MAG: hypothetical protein WC955_11545 [Elusimicrobiota bacterium]
MGKNAGLLLITCFVFATYVSAQEIRDGDALKMFLDCHDNISVDYIKTELAFVNYVSDRLDADIHILMTSQATAGGTKYSIDFIGLQKFEGKNETLEYVSNKTETEDEKRSGLLNTLKTGMVYYIAQTPLRNNIRVEYEEQGLAQKDTKDKWNNWVFTLKTSGDIEGDNTTNLSSIAGYVYADRITEGWKITNALGAKQSVNRYNVDGNEIVSMKNSSYLDSLVVKSLTNHWSVGGYFNYAQTTYENKKYSFKLAPAIEYNILPYREYNRKNITFLYRINWNNIEYYEETIYDKLSETLWSESLAVSASITQPWGSLYSTLEGSHYFHDINKQRLSLDSGIEVRIFKGFSLAVDGSYSIIHDQLALTKGEATTEEVLLTQKELETTYDYDLSVSINYMFGSIYSDVVNPRFSD